MCYAIPGQLIEILDSKIGVVDYFGEKRRVLLDLIDANVGDYVYAQGGILIGKIAESEAKEILTLWKDQFFELKRMDARLSQVDESTLPHNALQILQKVNLKKTLTRFEALALMQLSDSRELSVLYEVANHVRHREHGNSSCIHGILEFSNYCRRSCHYCGIRCERNIERYRMSVAEIIEHAKQVVAHYGFRALVLQSGEDLAYDENELIEIVKALRELNILVFLSIGSRDKLLYQALYDAGARAALLRFETSNGGIFEKLRPGTILDDRLQLIHDLKSMGYILATGFLFGLPGETKEDVVNNIFLTQSLKPDMISFGPLIPTQDTPLENQPIVSIDEALKIIAVMRCVDYRSNILVTTALETLDANAKRLALLAGANSMMINVTPAQNRKLYHIYDNRAGCDNLIQKNIQTTIDLLYSLGRAPTDIQCLQEEIL